jgi:hypothetical protein
MLPDYCQDEDKCQFWKIDVDQVKAIAQRCGVQSMPTFQIYQRGSKVNLLLYDELSQLKSLGRLL